MGIKERIKSIIPNAESRNLSLDAVRGFAILIVMLGHCIVLNELADTYFYDAIVAIQMPLFMAVSGYIAGLKPLAYDKKPDLKKFLLKLRNRTASYLVPFFSWMLITSAPNCLDELKAQMFQLDRGLWFLMTLWIITLVTSLAEFLSDGVAYSICMKISGASDTDDITKEKTKAAIIRFVIYSLIVGICYIGFFLQGRMGNTFLSPSLTVKYMPFYVIAYFVSLYLIPFLTAWDQKKERKLNLQKRVYLGLVISFVGFLYLIIVYDMIEVVNVDTLIAQMVASFLGVFICFYTVYHFVGEKIKKVFGFIGLFTLEIYVLHFRFARLLGLANKGLVPFHLDTILWILATFIVMSVCTTVCIIVVKQSTVFNYLLFGKIKKDVDKRK